VKSKATKSFLVFVLINLLLGVQFAQNATSAEQTQRYIVTFSDDDDSERESGDLRSMGIKVEGTYKNAFKGVVGQFTAAQINNLKKNPKFLYAELDAPVYTTTFSPTPIADGPSPAVSSWGIDRLNQRGLPLDNTYSYQYNGQGVTAYVIDTGLNTTHSEFTGRVSVGNSQINDGRGTTDCNGHGTHVAGTIGGTRYGVARAVTIVPVRVLDCAGSGTLSGVIAGIDWAIANHVSGPAVANLSLGSTFSATVNAAIARLVADGVVVAVAAGNSNANACNYSPSSEPTAITVGASTRTDSRASFSNFGTCLDIFAPGDSIVSSWIGSNSATNTISGTSMASPHVAGAAALLLEQYPAYTPQQIRELMVSMASAGKVLSAGTGSINALLTTLTADYVVGVRPLQTITFNQPAAMVTGNADQVLTASASSSMTVTFATNNSAICTIVSGNLLRAVGVGSCTVTANQIGYLTYAAAAPVARIVAITAPVPAPPAAPTVSTSIPNGTVGTLSVNLRGVNATSMPPITSYTINLYTSTANNTALTFVRTIQLPSTSLNVTTSITGLTVPARQFYSVTATANNTVGSSALSAASNRSRVG
jgi:subtilisin family serine protease